MRLTAMHARMMVALVVIASMVMTAVPIRAARASEGEVRELIGQLGVGARVRLDVDERGEVNGTIAKVERDAVWVTRGSGLTDARVAFTTVKRIRLPEMRYRASESRDPQRARQIALAVGTGNKLEIKGRRVKYEGHDPSGRRRWPEPQAAKPPDAS